MKFISPSVMQWLMIALIIAGLGVSGYLMWGYTVPGAVIACGGSDGCENVKNSAYSSILGVSLPLLGLLSYAALLFLVGGQAHPAVNRNGWTPLTALAIFGVALIGLLFSAYLTYLELFVIFAVCHWCVASAVIMTGIFILAIINLSQSNAVAQATPAR